ncbi:MAG: hypothetical protein MUF10_05880 [Thermoanaerobaculaceae bacterium]|nr:hypothetical protein [Thermoanaerobaculaceae bacterium]
MKRGIMVIALVAAPLLADDVYLRGGGQITGQIVEQTDERVTVNIGAGTMSVRMASVVRIERGASPIQEYQARAEKIPAGDAEAWRELARWAADEGLATMSGQAYSRVVAVLPNDPEANRALGRVSLGGKWVTEAESYRAQGFVEFEGEWMRPEEQRTILAERRAREEADRQALAAQIQADQEAERARKAKEDAEREKFMHGGLPQLGDPTGWGYGLTYWPVQPVQPGSYDHPTGGQ